MEMIRQKVEEVNLPEEGRRREAIILSRILTLWPIFKIEAERGNKDTYFDCSCDLMFPIKNASFGLGLGVKI